MTEPSRTLADLVADLRSQAASFLPAPGSEGKEGGGLALGRFLAASCDRILQCTFGADDAHGEVALAAVGSYGRGALAMRSDLDVRIVVRDAALAEPIVRDVIYPLWDASLSVGHQVLVLSEFLELAREDVATQTSLLDLRFVAGDRTLTEEVKWRGSGLFSGAAGHLFAERLAADMAKRHERFGDSLYLLEPDVKNTEGGLRDLDVTRWIARSRYGVGELDELLRVGAIGAREATALIEAQELLWRIRNLLHLHAGRRSDRLTFDEQEAIAPLLGYGMGGEAVERMMSDYYRAARTIARRTGILSPPQSQPGRRRQDEDLGDGIRVFDGSVTVDVERFRREPDLMLRVVRCAVARELPLSSFVRESMIRLTADPDFCEVLRASEAARTLFVELVATRKEARLARGTVARELHDLGLLLAMIPEFSPVVGRVHHDAYHVYTVDVHSVRAVDRFAALARGELGAEFPLASRLAAEVAMPRVLALGILLHDVGKAIGGKDHSVRGADMAKDILARLDFAPHEIDEVVRLILEHLTMYRLATRRDVDDPATIDEMLRAVIDQENLRNLYLLTVCDVSTTSPTSMTSWKAHMLDALYVATERALSGEREQGHVGRVSDEVREIASAMPEAERSFVEAFVASMPERYLVATPPAEIVAHARTAAQEGPVRMTVSASRRQEAAEVCVVADDRPGLLSMIARAFSGARLEVLAAHVYSRRREDGSSEAVDLFWVQNRVDGPLEPALARVERDLEAMMRGDLRPEDVREPRIGRSKGPRVATRVLLDHRASPTQTVIEVTTEDRPGVLFTIAQVFFELGLSIAVAKINTEGARVADVFYVTDARGEKVDKALGQQIEAKLFERLGGRPATHEAASQEASASAVKA